MYPTSNASSLESIHKLCDRYTASAKDLWKTLPTPTSCPEPNSSGYFDVSGVKIFHAEWGTGAPVSMLHGGLGSLEAHAGQIPALAANHHVITLDSHGSGRRTRDAFVETALAMW